MIAKELLKRVRAEALSIALLDRQPPSLTEAARSSSARFSVVVAIHDAPEATRRCLEMLEVFGGDAQVILVDDGSKLDETRTLIRRFVARNGWDQIRHEVPLRHSCATNAGSRLADRDFLLILNSDALVTTGIWEPAVNILEQSPRIGLLGPTTSWCATEQCDRIAQMCRLHWSNGRIEAYGRRVARARKADGLRNIPYVSGFAFFIRRALWESLQGFDESLPDYGNDNDLARRVFDRGLVNAWLPSIYIHHLGSESYGKANGYRERAAELAKRYLWQKHGSL